MSERHAEAAAERTAVEYEAIIRALRGLEDAIAAPAPGREREWKRTAARELGTVSKSLKAHCVSAERRHGILTEVEAEIGRTRDLTLARREHATLVRDAAALFTMLVDEDAEYPELRERAAKVILALRRHQAREADLIYTAFQRDIGMGD
jgi:hypothetical protein